MGIEDLNADLSEHAERILVIAPSEERAQKIGKILEQRSCIWVFALDIPEAAECSKQELFDMIVCDWDESQGSAMEAIEVIGAEPQLRRAPMLLLHPRSDEIPEDYLAALDLQLQLLQSPWEASALVVKVSAELRKRRLRLEEAKFYSKVSSQNVELRDLTNRFKRELKEAQDIQTAILPKMLPDAAGTLFAATYVPLEMVGGDLYDVWQISDDLYGLFIGDVTGHGLSAGLS